MARKRSRSRYTLANFADWVTDVGIKLGLVSFVLVLGYLIYGLVAKGGLTKIQGLGDEDRARVLANVAAACRILGISGTILAFCLAIRYYVEDTLGYAMSFLGVLLYFGTPWVFSVFIPDTDLESNQAIAMIVRESQLLALALFAPGIVLIIRDIVLRVNLAIAEKERRARRRGDDSFIVGDIADQEAKPPVRRRPGPYAKCWQMPYCRDFVRNMCPAYENRKSCWRIKAGCFCDERTMLRAMKMRTKESEMFERDVRYRTGSAGSKTELTSAQKRQRCRNCVVYGFHQQQKYRLISPLVFPAAAALIWYFFPAMESAFRSGVSYIDRFMDKVSFLPKPEYMTPTPSTVPDAVFWLFVVWVAIVIISYTLHLVEFCIFRLHI